MDDNLNEFEFDDNLDDIQISDGDCGYNLIDENEELILESDNEMDHRMTPNINDSYSMNNTNNLTRPYKHTNNLFTGLSNERSGSTQSNVMTSHKKDSLSIFRNARENPWFLQPTKQFSKTKSSIYYANKRRNDPNYPRHYPWIGSSNPNAIVHPDNFSKPSKRTNHSNNSNKTIQSMGYNVSIASSIRFKTKCQYDMSLIKTDYTFQFETII